MTTARKRTALAIMVAVLAVWPLVHHALVLGVGISPWHLFGWSMYCEPRSPVRVELYDVRGTPILTNRLPPAANAAMTKYGERRRALGRALPPDGLAADIFRGVPWLKRFQIAVISFDFRAEGHFERRVDRYTYAADD